MCPHERLRLAELTSTLGALVSGVGLGAIVGDRLGRLATVVLVIGIAIHGIGMLDKYRFGHRSGVHTSSWWRTLYWTCWWLVGTVALIVAARMLTVIED